MITSLRRAAPALALVAALSLRSAAQTDASFAAALNAIPTGAETIAKLKAKPQQPAPPKAPSAPDAVWQKVLEAVKKDGKYEPGLGPLPGSFSIEDSTGDPKADHMMRGISVLGMINDDEQFEAMGVILVVQEFKLDPKDGNFRVDQWMFQTDIYGEVGNAGHAAAIQSPDGETVSSTPEKLNRADPRIQAQYDSMLKHWAERKP